MPSTDGDRFCITWMCHVYITLLHAIEDAGHVYASSSLDGASLPGVDTRHPNATPSFVAHTASWDPFVIYIVNVDKPPGGLDVPPAPPPQPECPSPPPNAITSTNKGSQIPVYYNQAVVLQCLSSGVSPVSIIRKVDHATVVVGAGLQEGVKGVPDSYCPHGEVCGDPVSQLQKIAFEAKSVAPPSGSCVRGGVW